MAKIIVVGAGLFGSIAATLARKRGHQVTVVDSGEKYAASKASGCVLAPSWLNSLSKPQQERAMEVLRSLYTVHELSLSTQLGRPFRAHQVHPDQILVKPDIVGSVRQTGPDWVDVSVPEGSAIKERRFKGTVLVAAGIWSSSLIENMPKVRGLYGASLRLWNVNLAPSIHVYAPYRQAVAVNLPGNKEAWFGDGTALVEKTWMAQEEARISATVQRFLLLHKSLIPQNQIKVRVGARPYAEGYKAGYFAQAGDKLWVSTGGAKNGTVLAAWQAWRFCEEAL